MLDYVTFLLITAGISSIFMKFSLGGILLPLGLLIELMASCIKKLMAIHH